VEINNANTRQKDKNMKRSERIGKAILEQIFPNMRVVHTDTGREPGIYDFKLISKSCGKEAIAVEVTSTTIENIIKTRRIVGKHKSIEVYRLRRCWHIFLNEDFSELGKISKILGKLEGYLLQIEYAGIERFYSPIDASKHDCILKIWQDLRVEFGISRKNSRARILLSAAGAGGDLTPDCIQHTVEEIASKIDNINKLTKAEEMERHLFIVVDEETDYLGWRAMLDGLVPSLPPRLPPEIDTVWLATWTPCGNYLLWKVTPTDGWQVVGKIDVFQKCRPPNHET